MQMTHYIGTKQIKATPMTRGDYHKYRGWTLPTDECGTDKGFLVEYQDGGKPNDGRHAGYISWSPADVFLAAYKPADGMSLGLAIEAMQQGYAVARKGWNRKGIFLRIAHPNPYGSMTQPFVYIDTMGLETDNPDAPHGRVPWLASQTDLLATDWVIV